MNFTRIPPAWLLPVGVDGPLWEYTHTSRLAAEEDAYFADHPLFEADARALERQFREPGRLVDLGCGAGRHSLSFAARGFSVTAVDMARPMLEMVDRKARERGLELTTVQSNLCQLSCFADGHFDYALSMFSTLGMIRGREPRRHALAEASRILRPSGRLALHAHNFWLNLRDPQGRRWLGSQLWPALFDRANFGDRRMMYRGIADMKVHLYRWGELNRDLRRAGFLVEDVLPLDEVSATPMEPPYLLHRFRAGGWIVFARRQS